MAAYSARLLRFYHLQRRWVFMGVLRRCAGAVCQPRRRAFIDRHSHAQ